MEFFAGLARGSYLGCIGWTALVISNSVATVGHIFIVQSITVMLIGPVVGIWIDRYQHKSSILIAQTIIVAAMLWVAILLFYAPVFQMRWLFIAVSIISLARVMYRGTFDCVIKTHVFGENLLSIIARSNSIHLISTAMGMAGIGLIIRAFGVGSAFAFSALASTTVLLISLFLEKSTSKSNAKGLKGYLSDFKNGLIIFQSNAEVRLLAILSAITLPIGQLTNAILSSFIRDDLGGDSVTFGIVDAGWAIGGMLAAALLSKKIKKFNYKYSEYVVAIFAGISTLLFSFSTSTSTLVIVHGLMGFFIWTCRILIAEKVIRQCNHESIGRVRVYIESIVGMSAMVMCFSPSVIAFEATAVYFRWWGGFLILVTIILLCKKRKMF